MLFIFNKIDIDLTDKEEYTVVLPAKMDINKLYFKIEHDPSYAKTTMFMDVLDGKEKLIQLNLNDSGIKEGGLNKPGIFKSENFGVEKIKLICYRELRFTFSLWTIS
ncbi:MAG: hypothetical protein JWO32_1893 [Bacteroidetes bacterium]|nr:hypothetical protein [Bacteroidota bacterium]